eukprot:ANDGO_00627.mRNA.1 Bardet-Biedl syndrome 1 protein homolog
MASSLSASSSFRRAPSSNPNPNPNSAQPASASGVATSTANALNGKGVVTSLWLDAWRDSLAGIQAFSECVCLADLNGDGDYKLIVADNSKHLRVFKGTSLVHEKGLLDTPIAIAAYYMDYATPRRPVVAVAAGGNVFLYKNLEPFYKYSIPAVKLSDDEMRVWQELKAAPVPVAAAASGFGSGAGSESDLHGDRSTHDGSKRELSEQQQQQVDDEDVAKYYAAFRLRLEDVRSCGIVISTRSQDFLYHIAQSSTTDLASWVKQVVMEPFMQQSVVVCMAVMNKDREDDSGLGCLVIGTEHREILVLDPAGSKLLKSWTLPSPPVFLSCTGVMDVDYRITVSCRDGVVYSIKQGEVSGDSIVLDAYPCGLVRTGKTTIVGLVNHSLVAYQAKGKRAWSVANLPSAISAMDLVHFGLLKTVRALVVALENGDVRVYNEQALIHTATMPEAMVGMKFGRYGREDACLILLGRSGSLYIKILPRKAQLDIKADVGPPPEQDIPLALPKKTKLYVDQTHREREFSLDMHRIFQRDLCRIRLTTVRAYAKMVLEGQGPVSYTGGANVRLNAKVQGLGPLFKIRLELTNQGADYLLAVPVSFSYNQSIYRVHPPLFSIPSLVPGLKYTQTVSVECLDSQGTADIIRVFLCNPKAPMPYLTAVINMPPSELPFAD